MPLSVSDTEVLCGDKKEERERFVSLVTNTMVRACFHYIDIPINYDPAGFFYPNLSSLVA